VAGGGEVVQAQPYRLLSLVFRAKKARPVIGTCFLLLTQSYREHRE
jgi:hypothetical protein